MVILRPDFPVDDEKKEKDIFAKLVPQAMVKDVRILGKKKFCYPIKKQSEGVYILASLEAETMNISAIEREVRMGTDVLRYLVLAKKEEKGRGL